MKLSQLLGAVKALSASLPADPEISGLSEDSRRIEKGFLFFARRGEHDSGLRHLADALARGAAAVVSEEPLGPLSVPVIRVRSFMEAEADLAARFYGEPGLALPILGVTGTNGKTTFTYLLEAIARENGLRPGVIGTINYRIPKAGSADSEILPAPNTTPHPLALQELLARMRERKCDLVVMEVSSHALALGRVTGIDFDGAVFTNLTQDHLDFHKTMEDYFLAKARLFEGLAHSRRKNLPGAAAGAPDKFAIINSDDPYGVRLLERTPAAKTLYGLGGEAEFRAEAIELSASGIRFKVRHPEGTAALQMRLAGRHNVYNALAACAAARRAGIPFSAIVRGLQNIASVPGRLEAVDCGQDFTVLVDYAHTEDALKNVLESVRQFARSRILVLFGCGGDRDRSKRPLMGELAVKLADWVVVTSDNPRSEDPRQIALDIEMGIHRSGKKNYDVVIDREEAIRKILALAAKDDVVVLAGKGHETCQIFADRTVPFDDREAARRILCSR